MEQLILSKNLFFKKKKEKNTKVVRTLKSVKGVCLLGFFRCKISLK